MKLIDKIERFIYEKLKKKYDFPEFPSVQYKKYDMANVMFRVVVPTENIGMDEKQIDSYLKYLLAKNISDELLKYSKITKRFEKESIAYEVDLKVADMSDENCFNKKEVEE